jgi:hypothetical protein
MRDASLLASVFVLAVFSSAHFGNAANNEPQISPCEQAYHSADGQRIAKHCQHAQYYGGRRSHDDDGPGAPSGSFVESCRNTRQKGWTVYSECRDRRGNWSRTSLDFRSCPGYLVENLNGNLVCER